VEGWEDEMLEELDGAEHVVEYTALEPMELFERVQHDDRSGFLIKHVRY
jgi:hypothetical protein